LLPAVGAVEVAMLGVVMTVGVDDIGITGGVTLWQARIRQEPHGTG
jgi:hypothetical protein